MLRVSLTFDGGSRGNPGPAYGSYLLQSRTPALPDRRLKRLRFGRGTNNEAEYWTLVAGLKDLRSTLAAAGLRPADVELTVRGDSQLVLSQLKGEWKAKDARMRRHRDETLDLLDGFGKVHLVHQPRARSVRTLGH
ncbi:MAG TPA: ribonuclease HI family protein [Anaerolineales bacterium]|nr:ribonuclease HI family protein [Anaerolineales bacterium]